MAVELLFLNLGRIEMNKLPIILALEKKFEKKNIDEFSIGDIVNVHTVIKEGDKSRIQLFGGVVIARAGRGLSATFTVRRTSYNEGMERVFLEHSPSISRIEVLRKSVVRRAKLTFLRERSGKSAKLRQKVISKPSKPSPTSSSAKGE